MKNYVLLFLTILVVGCATNSYQKFYKPSVDTKTLTDVELLKPEQNPQIFGTDNFEKDEKTLRAKHYISVGSSAFNGGYEGEDKVIAQAKRIGATLVLMNSKYTHTLTTTSPLFLPRTTTTHHSGTILYGGDIGSYDGTSTSHGTTVVPITKQQMRYDQTAMFFVKSNEKLKFGVVPFDLSSELKTNLERNTGALIYLVVEDTPSFYANILDGDILIKVDDINITNAKHALDVLGSYNTSKGKCIFKVIRNGKEKDITINFN